MPSPYKRRRPSVVKNVWVYRRLVGLAAAVGLLLWFISANNDPVTVSFPFRLGQHKSTTGLVILMSALIGSAVTAVALTLVYAWRGAPFGEKTAGPDPNPLRDDRPPADYAAKA